MSTGNKGRFSERLKKIAFWKKNRSDSLNQNNQESGMIKRFFLIPVMFFQKKVDNTIDNKDDAKIDEKLRKMKEEVSVNNYDQDDDVVNSNDTYDANDRKIKVQNIKNIDIVLLRQIHDDNLKRYHNINSVNDKIINDNSQNQSAYNNSVNLQKEELEKDIINILRKDLVKQINELEILQSDLYVLKEIDNDDIYYNKCCDNIIEIKKILSRIKDLKEKYDYLKNNNDFEDLLNIKDEQLYEKIISLKNVLETDNVPFVVDDYKLLEEYKFLYLKIDKFKSDAESYEEEKNKKVDELRKRDIDFEDFKNKVNNVSSLSEGYEKFVNEQDQMMHELDEQIDKIDSVEKVTYSFKGFGKLLGNSFKYLGLLLMSPLKGMFPNIAIQTLATKNIINNLSNSLKLEENRYTVYEAVDYSKEIALALNDLDYTGNLINNSLNDIANLKRNFKEKFQKYNGNFKEYHDAIKKLNKIENSIINNKVKVELIKEKMLINEKINDQKMAKVLKLNENNK